MVSRVERVQHVGERDRVGCYLQMVGQVERALVLQVALRVRRLTARMITATETQARANQ